MLSFWLIPPSMYIFKIIRLRNKFHLMPNHLGCCDIEECESAE